MALSPEQRRVLAAINRIGGQVGASPKELKAAVETGLVESNLTNPSGGDADSVGWRQERASLYPNPGDLDASIKRFFGETRAVKAKYGTAGALAAAVQRPRADLRGKYQQRSADAEALLRSMGAFPRQQAGAGPTSTYTPGSSSFTPNTASAGAGLSDILAATLSGQKQSVSAPSMLEAPSFSSSKYVTGAALPQAAAQTAAPKLDVGAALSALESAPSVASVKTTPGTTTTTQGAPTTTITRTPGATTITQKALANAAAIDAKHMPYLWGGGHAAKINAKNATPLDCSGAVSAVLGIDPRVASQFKTFGSAGDGGNKGITVYAKDDHVLMKINGKFFGTSATNPGGGAGWIPAKALSAAYLSKFTARHLARS